jgi:cation:H+ antiporter
MNMEKETQAMGIPQLLLNKVILINGTLFVALIAMEQSATEHIFISLLFLALSLVLLIKSADFFIEGAKGLALRAGLPEVVIGLTIVSIGTSLPEILVTSAAAVDIPKKPEIADLAIGGIYGSILVQISLILGVVVAIQGVKIRPSWLKRDGMIMLASIALLTVFLVTGSTITRIEGFILALLYCVYVAWLLNHRDEILEEEGVSFEGEVSGSKWSTTSYIFMVVVGLVLALFAAHYLVTIASDIAIKLNVPHAVVGTTISGLGTSLPELTIALLAAKKSEGVAIGTLIGSNITDPLFSIGIAAMVHELPLTQASYGLTMYIIVPMTFICTLFALYFMRSKYELKKTEGYILILVYLAFLVLLYAAHQDILPV